MKDYKFAIILGIVVIVLILVAVGMEWSKSGSSKKSSAPYDLVTTFKGDAERVVRSLGILAIPMPQEFWS